MEPLLTSFIFAALAEWGAKTQLLAIALARLFNKEVAFVDADLWFGDASVLLDLRARQSMTSLVAT